MVKEIWQGKEPDFERALTGGFEWGEMTKEMKSAMMRNGLSLPAELHKEPFNSELRITRAMRLL